MTPNYGKGNIQLGDLIQALSRLGWRNGHASDIAASLGFNISQLPDKKSTPEISDPRLRDKKRETPAEARPPRAPVTPPTPDISPPLPALKSGNQRLSQRTEPIRSVDLDEKWTEAINELPGGESQPHLARGNLFPDRVSRHLFTAALNTQRLGRDIDIARLIDRICHAPLIIDLPYTVEFSLDAGCHLLRDFSHSMTPFREDLIALEGQVREVISNARLHAYHFDTLPSNPMRWTSSGEPEKWQADGRPVLVATDFGVQGAVKQPRLNPQWHSFIDRCKQSSSPLVFLTPWPEEYAPLDIGTYARLLHWSPHTTVAMIKRQLSVRTQ